jgi:hypothetical protein
MKTSLIIDLPCLPEEGLMYSGELDGSIFDLPDTDARAAGPMAYDLWAQRFESELLLTGSLSAPFEFTCVVTLKTFLKTIRIPQAAISVEIGNASGLNVSDALREEILIEFPTDPRCDEGDVPEPCEIDSRYLAVDKTPEHEVSHPPRDGGDDRWSALDDLSGLNDQPQ